MTYIKKLNIFKVLIVLVMILSINTIKIFAQTSLKFRNITIEQGLSQGTIEDLYQDSKGYIWIGTQDGLNRYNGYEFKQYRHNEKSKNSIVSNNIIKIKEDKDNNIWVGTIDGVSKISKDGKIKNYKQGSKNGNISDDNVCDILVTSDGKVLVGTINGLNIYNENKDRFERILSKESDLTDQFIYCLDEDKNKNIWIGTSDGLNKINTKNKNIDKIYLTKDKKPNEKDTIYGLYMDKEGYVWIGTMKNGLFKIDINTNKIKLHKISKQNKELDFVKNILKDTEGNIWVCTDDGLLELSEDGNKEELYKNRPYDSHSLISNSTRCIMQDKNGLIWVGTYTGISIFDPKNRVTQYQNDPYDKNSLSSSVIHGIYEDKDGLIWVGTRSDGINIINRKKDTIRQIEKGILTDDRIRYITGKNDDIWIGTNSGLNRINKKTKKIKYYTLDNGLLDNYIRTIYIDGEYVFVATRGGVNIINSKTNEISNINDLLVKYKIPKDYISCIYKDKEGIYWLGTSTEGGLISINPKTKKVKIYKKKDGLSTNEIRNVVEDNNKNLWIATNYGLNKLDKETGKIIYFTEQEGLPNNTVYGVVLDDKNNPWMSTNNGISKFDVKNNKFINLNVTDGLQGNEFNGNACFKNSKGEILFGGINGLNIINPNNLVTSKDISRVMIDDISVNGVVFEEGKNLEFKSDENTIEIKFFLPDYKNTQRIQYVYKLEGSNDSWHTIKDNKVTYTNLRPGSYKFMVKAINNNGVMSEKTNINFKINPPWWRSKEALVIYALIIIAIIVHNQRKMKRLDKLVGERTEELREEMEKNKVLFDKVIELEKNKNNYFINLSHELRTPLNLIRSTEQLITGLNNRGKQISSEKIEYYMSILRKNSNRLLRLINNIIDTSKIENGNYILNVNEHDIVYLVEESALSLSNLAHDKGIELIVDPYIEEKTILCDSYDIDRCIVNLVNNAIKFTSEGGKVEVIIKEVGTNVQIEISDTGVGIEEKYHHSIFNRFNQVVDEYGESKQGSGLGLTITKHIINLHKGDIYVESELGKGTKFTIILPENMYKNN
ncbi:ligand-binding sensor domain-containing protein [Romboutsia sp. 1001713B170131_170501_G6]|uniref:ligand-binding sensor domain-containing protein n=1 Tax=Romboutsia sp. 1001713B170131_170501_G6 TaxID=2787108 RepID=UPI0018A9B6A1|nr:sensor histidine kinase [Romboutsia sp. 1001713B170131_170501_G6]